MALAAAVLFLAYGVAPAQSLKLMSLSIPTSVQAGSWVTYQVDVVSKNRPPRRFIQRLSVVSREGTAMEYGAWVELKTTESGRTRFERGYFARPEGGGKGSDPTSEGGPRLTLARYQRLMPDGTLYEYPVGQEGAPLLDEDVSAMDLIDFAGASVSDSLFSDTLRVGRAAVACQVKQVRRYGKEDWQGADSTYVNRAVMTRTSWQSPGVPVTGYARSMVEVSTERVSTAGDSVPESAPIDSTAGLPDSVSQVPPPSQDPSPKRGEFFYRAELTLLDIGHDAVPEITQVPEPAPEDGTPRARRVIK